MPLWLDLLRTPMAAPETPALRRMRRTWQALCLMLASAVLLVRSWPCAAGPAGLCAVAALLVGTLAYTMLYAVRKLRADRAYLDELGRQP